jgi:hypothetical protein
MVETSSFKRLILRAVLHQVSPMVIRLVSVSDQMQLPDFDDVFRAILGWQGDLGFIIRVHGQEFNSFRRKTQSKESSRNPGVYPASCCKIRNDAEVLLVQAGRPSAKANFFVGDFGVDRAPTP